MICELSQRFYFEAAHTLARAVDAEPSQRIHGHTYMAEVTVRGEPDPETLMVMDLGFLRRHLDRLREQLDHRFLDEVADLRRPTLEGLCHYIVDHLRPVIPGLAQVSVWREASGDRCTLRLLS